MTTSLDRWLGFAHRYRRVVASLVYSAVAVVSLAAAFLLRFELEWPVQERLLYLAAVPWMVFLRIVYAQVFRLSHGRWRFVGVSDVGRLTLAVLAGSTTYFLLSWVVPVLPRLPRSVLLIDAVVTEYLTAAVWIGYRIVFERMRRAQFQEGTRRRVIMVGAGDAGQMLVREMQRTPTGMVPVAYVDDDRIKWGTRIHGVKVRGAIEDLPRLVEEMRADEVVIAVPSAQPTQIRRIVELCEQTGRRFSILPGIAEVLMGEAHLSQVREVRVEDLLGRDPVVMELPAVRADVKDRCVLITGAAGSIGSELARQIALHNPGRIVLADQAETPLYYLDLELRGEFPGVDVVPYVVDVAEAYAVERMFAAHKPARVFHAAAYKHVPMMERHPLEAMRNNVIGTWVVADAAGRHGTENFVLVSTDKAVRPANIMGASKRMAELCILEAQRHYAGTRYGAVRFGNVLGSAGSVVPLFRKQLAEGKPLTVTHAEVTRYFMTIPEAVQLILKASLLPELAGHVAMLEMGEPVKILDMARNLLRLVGSPYKPGENVVFTGLRPGEKLAEELVAPEERVLATDVDQVRLIVSDCSPDGTWLSDVELLALKQGNAELLLDSLLDRFPLAANGGRGTEPAVAPVVGAGAGPADGRASRRRRDGEGGAATGRGNASPEEGR